MHIAFIEFDYFEPEPQRCRFSDITWPLAEELAQQGHQITVIAPSQGEYAHPNITSVPVPAAISQRQNVVVQVKRAWALARVAKQINADVYHVHQSVMAAMMVLIGLGKQTVWQGHSNYYQRTQLGRAAYDRQMDRLIFFSTKIAARQVMMLALGEQVVHMWQKAGFASQRIEIAPYGIGLPAEMPAANWSCAAWEGKRLKVVYVGRLSADKGGQTELFEALTLLKVDDLSSGKLANIQRESTRYRCVAAIASLTGKVR